MHLLLQVSPAVIALQVEFWVQDIGVTVTVVVVMVELLHWPFLLPLVQQVSVMLDVNGILHSAFVKSGHNASEVVVVVVVVALAIQ